MNKRPTFKLLSKTTLIYLVFTFIAFFVGARFLIREADEFIERNLAHRFRKSEERIKKHIEAGKPLDELSASVTRVPEPPLPGAYPVFSDTLIHNAEMDEFQTFRRKAIIIEVGGEYYRAVISKSVEDFFRLRDDIFATLLPAFVLLAFGIVLFNMFLSGYLFRPFTKILELMRTYEVGTGKQLDEIDTTTTEFQKMQALFHRMVARIEHDYRHLKEYTENMAHELQTPLAVIRNKTELLIADDRVMRRHADTVKIIYDETSHLSKLSNTLNLLTKIENREFNEVTRIQTEPVIAKHVAAANELAQLRSLNFETDLSHEHSLLIDRHLLDIVLKNLLGNAINYGTPEGPIRIKTTSTDLLISNFGPPLNLPPERVFDRFKRNHSRPSSLGLGLALVKNICDLSSLEVGYRYAQSQHVFTIANNGVAT